VPFRFDWYRGVMRNRDRCSAHNRLHDPIASAQADRDVASGQVQLGDPTLAHERDQFADVIDQHIRGCCHLLLLS
jgi:hypothetical protein